MATVKLEGFGPLDKALGEMPKRTGKATLTRALKKAAKPLDDEASGNAPFLKGGLQKSVITGTRLTASQQTDGAELVAGVGYRRAAKNYVEMHVGTADPKGMWHNFGTFKDPPTHWFDRAWTGTQGQVLGLIKTELATEIEKTRQRVAKKLAKGA